MPSGRTYRRGALTRRATIANLAAGFRRSRLNRNRVIVGANFHRASAKGQPPAVDTAGLLNSIRAKKTGQMRSTVATSKKYADILDDPKRLDRPFFRSTVKRFAPKFRANIEKVIKESG